MFVCSRRQGESIWIDEKIRIVLARIEGSTAKIGIEAPKEVNIRREEVPPIHGGDDTDCQTGGMAAPHGCEEST